MLLLPKKLNFAFYYPQKFTEIQTIFPPNCPPVKEIIANDAKGTE
tara:strand:- start:496 stop:630 length:135 start_codon:yes stop_codon:yes gene_type:complete